MEQEKSKSHHFKEPPTSLSQLSIEERGRRIKMAAEIGLARSSRGRHWSRALRRHLLLRKGGENGGCSCKKEALAPTAKVAEDLADGEEDEVEEMETKVKVLQRLVPGGEALEVERLFEETADYIEALEGQVKAMRALASFVEGLEREKRMLAG